MRHHNNCRIETAEPARCDAHCCCKVEHRTPDFSRSQLAARQRLRTECCQLRVSLFNVSDLTIVSMLVCQYPVEPGHPHQRRTTESLTVICQFSASMVEVGGIEPPSAILVLHFFDNFMIYSVHDYASIPHHYENCARNVTIRSSSMLCHAGVVDSCHNNKNGQSCTTTISVIGGRCKHSDKASA